MEKIPCFVRFYFFVFNYNKYEVIITSKRKKIFISVIAFFMAVLSAIMIVGGKWVYYRIYPWDRITVKIHATVDDKAVSKEQISVFDMDELFTQDDVEYKKGNELKIKTCDDFYKFSVKGDCYGNYHFLFVVDSYHFRLDAYQWNWWDVQDIDLYIDIKSDDNTYTFYQKNSYISEEFGYIKSYESTNPETLSIAKENTIFIGTS